MLENVRKAFVLFLVSGDFHFGTLPLNLFFCLVFSFNYEQLTLAEISGAYSDLRVMLGS